MKWEHLLKKQWTEDDYDHPVVKNIFIRLNEEIKMKIRRDPTYIIGPEFKALKLFEDVSSQYNISNVVREKSNPSFLSVKLPNNTSVHVILHQRKLRSILNKKYPDVIISLKGELCRVCIKAPRGATLPFFDYLVSMVGLAASDGRGTNIEAFNLANDLIEGGVEWDLILYSPVNSNMGWFNEIAKKDRNSDKLDFILETLDKYNPKNKQILLSEIKFVGENER